MRTRRGAVVIGFAVLRSTAAFGYEGPTPTTPPPSLARKISVALCTPTERDQKQ